MEIELGLTEKQLLDQASEILSLDLNTRVLAEHFFKEFKDKKGNLAENKALIGAFCATFLAARVIHAEKDQNNGARNTSINEVIDKLNKISQSSITLQGFFVDLKELVDNVVTIPSNVSDEIRDVMKKFNISKRLFEKYQLLVEKLDLRDRSNDDSNNYLDSIKRLNGLLYLDLLNSIEKGKMTLSEVVFLLTEAVAHMIYFMPDHIQSAFFQKENITLCDAHSDKKNKQIITEKVFATLYPNESNQFEESQKMKLFSIKVEKLTEQNILKATNEDTFEGIYSSNLISQNLASFESFYRERLSINDLDEKFYWSVSPKHQLEKPSPMLKQGSVNKLNIHINVTSGDHLFLSQGKSFPQPLPFRGSEHAGFGVNLKTFKNPSQFPIPASPQPHMLISGSATPVSGALEMWQWLKEILKSKKNAEGVSLTPVLDKHLFTLMDVSKEDLETRFTDIINSQPLHENAKKLQKQLKDNQQQIRNLYFKILEELLIQEEKKIKRPQYDEILKNDDFHRALIACSIEVIFFISTSTEHNLENLLEFCQLSPFQFWRIIPNFVKFDLKLPSTIKKHFYELELQILMSLAWKKNSEIPELLKSLIEDKRLDTSGIPFSDLKQVQINPFDSHFPSGSNESTKGTNFISEDSNEATKSSLIENESHSGFLELNHSQLLFFKRVLHHTAILTFQLCDKLRISETSMEHVWTTIQHVLAFQTSLLIERNIIQLLMCCIYGVCRVFKINCKMTDIIQKAQEFTVFQKEVIQQVSDRNQRVHIITFYNTVFNPNLKDFLRSLSNSQSVSNTPILTPNLKLLVPSLVSQSPLKDFLQKQLKPAGMFTPDPRASLYKQTPRTKAIYAFGESSGEVLETLNKETNKRRFSCDFADSFLDRKIQKTSANTFSVRFLEKETDSSRNQHLSSKRNLFGSNSNTVKNTDTQNKNQLVFSSLLSPLESRFLEITAKKEKEEDQNN